MILSHAFTTFGLTTSWSLLANNSRKAALEQTDPIYP